MSGKGSRESRREVIGLRYDRDGEDAPRVVARGKGTVADRILELAREHGVPVREDPDLVELLATAELGEEIPVEMYAVVARLLSYLYGLNEGLSRPPC